MKESLGVAGFKAIEQLYSQIVEKDTAKALSTINEIYFDGYDLNQFAKDFLEFLRDQMLAAVKENDHAKTVLLVEMIDQFQWAYEIGRSAVIPQLPLEMAVIKI
ncbi:MAG: hypothetical protein ACD_63C00190G0001, partial [uncultured bacterium]